jgi:hypothetical protein
MFSDVLLDDPSLAFLGAKIAGEFVAGCIANKSANCVGISNIYSSGSLICCLDQAKAAVSSFAPDLPITGYAAGPVLHAAQQAGFHTIGDLQVLVAENAFL